MGFVKVRFFQGALLNAWMCSGREGNRNSRAKVLQANLNTFVKTAPALRKITKKELEEEDVENVPAKEFFKEKFVDGLCTSLREANGFLAGKSKDKTSPQWMKQAYGQCLRCKGKEVTVELLTDLAQLLEDLSKHILKIK